MRMASFLLICCVAAMMWPVAADADVKVSFIEPGRYTDAGLHSEYGAKSRSATLAGIQQHLERLGERYLKPGQDLTIDVLDIDLAGRFEMWRINARDLRIMREVTWPRIEVRYTLEQNGAVVASGEETVADLNYLMRAGLAYSSDPLRYEKVMLDEWFKTRFVERQPIVG